MLTSTAPSRHSQEARFQDTHALANAINESRGGGTSASEEIAK